MDVVATLAERGLDYEVHGSFEDGATIARTLTNYKMSLPGWKSFSPAMQYVFTMLDIKEARALNGNCRKLDNYIDMAGYLQLLIDILKKEAAAEASKEASTSTAPGDTKESSIDLDPNDDPVEDAIKIEVLPAASAEQVAASPAVDPTPLAPLDVLPASRVPELQSS